MFESDGPTSIEDVALSCCVEPLNANCMARKGKEKNEFKVIIVACTDSKRWCTAALVLRAELLNALESAKKRKNQFMVNVVACIDSEVVTGCRAGSTDVR